MIGKAKVAFLGTINPTMTNTATNYSSNFFFYVNYANQKMID